MLIALCFALVLPYSLYAQNFIRETESVVVNTSGDSRSANWIDYDNDGDLDLFVSNGPEEQSPNFLFRNDSGIFVQITNDPLVTLARSYDGATWGDFDNDGDADVFIASWYGQTNGFFENDGDGTFTRITTGVVATDATYSETGSWADYDNDGWLDLFLCNSAGPNHTNHLYHNNGDGSFTRITGEDIVNDTGGSRVPLWADYDNDGDLDLLITNEGNQNEYFYDNNSGVYEQITTGDLVNSGGTTMTGCWGDYDNDSDFDVYLGNAGNSGINCNATDYLFRNDDGIFTRIDDTDISQSGGCTFGSTWGDFDNDGDLDLYATNGYRTQGNENFYYVNNNDGTFTQITDGPHVNDGGWAYGCAAGDYDRDGDLDIFCAKWTPPTDNDALFINQTAQENENHWLELKLVGTVSNRSAIGTKVRVKATINGIAVWQLRQVEGQSGYCGQNLELHFGFGDAAIIDSLVIEWPAEGIETFTNLNANQYLTVIQDSSLSGVQPRAGTLPKSFATLTSFPNPFNPSTEIQFSLLAPGEIELTIFDIQGREIILLAKGSFPAGEQKMTWNGMTAQGDSVPAGTYFCRLTAPDFVTTLKLIRIG